jgi:hypothetical protein
MPLLPIIDLLILMGWTSLFSAFVLKAVTVTTSYQPSLFGMGPLDLTILAGVMLLMSVAVSARSFVKSMEATPSFARSDRAAATLEAYSQVQSDAARAESGEEYEEEPPADPAPRGPHSAISA